MSFLLTEKFQEISQKNQIRRNIEQRKDVIVNFLAKCEEDLRVHENIHETSSTASKHQWSIDAHTALNSMKLLVRNVNSAWLKLEMASSEEEAITANAIFDSTCNLAVDKLATFRNCLESYFKIPAKVKQGLYVVK